jgi:hypothetical protein
LVVVGVVEVKVVVEVSVRMMTVEVEVLERDVTEELDDNTTDVEDEEKVGVAVVLTLLMLEEVWLAVELKSPAPLLLLVVVAELGDPTADEEESGKDEDEEESGKEADEEESGKEVDEETDVDEVVEGVGVEVGVKVEEAVVLLTLVMVDVNTMVDEVVRMVVLDVEIGIGVVLLFIGRCDVVMMVGSEDTWPAGPSVVDEMIVLGVEESQKTRKFLKLSGSAW